MDCTPSKNNTRTHIIIWVCTASFGVAAALLLFAAMRWQSILAEIAQIRINRVKRG